MLLPISGLLGLVMAILSAFPAASQGAATGAETSLLAQREALKAVMEQDMKQRATLSFVHHGVLPDPSHAPAFWSLVDILSEKVSLPDRMQGNPRPFVIAQAAADLMPSCRVPYEKLAGEIGRRSGSGTETMDITNENVRALISSPVFLREHAEEVDAARRELILATDLTCEILAPRKGHGMTAVAAMRLAGDIETDAGPVIPKPAGEVCRTRPGKTPW